MAQETTDKPEAAPRAAAVVKRFVALADVPPRLILDGHRVAFDGEVLGQIVSAWSRGIWLRGADTAGGHQAIPWWPPDEKSIADVVERISVELDDWELRL